MRPACLLPFALLLVARSAAAEEGDEPGSTVRFSVRQRGIQERSDAATLERREPDGWASICSAPCELRLDPRALYRVTTRLSTSKPFILGPGNAVTIRASLGDPFFKVMGVTTGLFGAFFTTFGVAMLASSRKLYVDDAEQPTATKTAFGIGVTTLGVSMLVGGVLMYVRGGSTRVDIEPTPTIAKPSSLKWSGAGFVW